MEKERTTPLVPRTKMERQDIFVGGHLVEVERNINPKKRGEEKTDDIVRS